jgi:hypothetical protein
MGTHEIFCIFLPKQLLRAAFAGRTLGGVELFHKYFWRMRPCQGSSKLRSRNAQAKLPPSRCWVPPDWVFRWWAARPQPQRLLPIFRKPIRACPTTASFLAKKRWPTSASPRSISSIGKTSAAVACSSPADAVAVAVAMVAGVAVASTVVAVASTVVAVASVVAVVAVASEVAAGAEAAGSGSALGLVAAGSLAVLAAPVVPAAPAAAYPGEPAACVIRRPDRRQPPAPPAYVLKKNWN